MQATDSTNEYYKRKYVDKTDILVVIKDLKKDKGRQTQVDRYRKKDKMVRWKTEHSCRQKIQNIHT